MGSSSAKTLIPSASKQDDVSQSRRGQDSPETEERWIVRELRRRSSGGTLEALIAGIVGGYLVLQYHSSTTGLELKMKFDEQAALIATQANTISNIDKRLAAQEQNALSHTDRMSRIEMSLQAMQLDIRVIANKVNATILTERDK